MVIKALLIGINEYPIAPLDQCVNDVKKVSDYLNSLEKENNNIEKVFQKCLVNKDATKAAIIESILEFYKNSDSDDILLFYFTGHGVREEAGGRFNIEGQTYVDSIVCFSEKINSKSFLSNKEIRYIFSNIKNDAKIVSIFDCCHSGNIAREVKQPNFKLKRLYSVFPARPYNNFIFSEKIKEEELIVNNFGNLLANSDKNYIVLSACQSEESAWEDSQGGIFTRLLLNLLREKINLIRYKDLPQVIKFSLQRFTPKKQIPRIGLFGKGELNLIDCFLNIHENSLIQTKGYITFNGEDWIFNKGIIDGLNIDSLIEVNDEKLNINELGLTSSIVEYDISVDANKTYPVNSYTTFSYPKIYIKDLDYDDFNFKRISKILLNDEHLELTEDEDSAHYTLCLFNYTVYFTFPFDYYRPLHYQLNVFNDQPNNLAGYYEKLLNWFQVNSLTNPENTFDVNPIKVEIQLPKNEYNQVENNTNFYAAENNLKRYRGEQYYSYNLKISNISDHSLYLTCLYLRDDFSISAENIKNQVRQLKPGESIILDWDQDYDFKSAEAIDHYKEFYNWQYQTVRIKIIYSQFEDFSYKLIDLTQSALPHPRGVPVMAGNIYRNANASISLWGVHSFELSFLNPTYNIISGHLLERFDNVHNDEIIAPFIKELYLKEELKGLISSYENLPNSLGQTDINEKNISGLKKDIGNFLADRYRQRKFRYSLKKFPNKPIIIAEGDSWFLYPFLVKDTLDYIINQYPVRSLAAAGDELENYWNEGTLFDEINKINPDFVLISGGGNDIIGPDIYHLLNDGVASNQEVELYLNSKFSKSLDKLKLLYNNFFSKLHNTDVTHTFVHGYDYVRGDASKKFIKNGWVNKYMIKKGIINPSDRSKIIKHLIDSFNEMLHNLSNKYDKVTYIDMRGQVSEIEWFDEIHPNNSGFKKVANRFLNNIREYE